MLHKLSFIFSCIVAILTILMAIFPEWVRVDVHFEEEGMVKAMTGGLFYSCYIGNDSLRWVNCERHRYNDMPWYSLVQALYVLAILLTVINVPVHYKALDTRKGRTLRYRAAPTSLTFVALGFQVVTIGLYGDHFDSQSWCILRYANEQRTVCTDVLNLPGETATFGWTYWMAVVTAIFSAVCALVDYAILNDSVEIS